MKTKFFEGKWIVFSLLIRAVFNCSAIQHCKTCSSSGTYCIECEEDLICQSARANCEKYDQTGEQCLQCTSGYEKEPSGFYCKKTSKEPASSIQQAE